MRRCLAALSVIAVVVARGSASDAVRLSLAARSLQPGEVVVVTAALPEPAHNIRVQVFQHEIAAFPVNDRTWEALIGIDLAVRPGRYPITIDGRGTTHGLQAETM